MDFLEKDLEEIIFNADSEALEEKGLQVNGKRFRQLRIGNYGIADMVTFDKSMGNEDKIGYIITVYELKKDKIGISAFLQAVNYVRGIKSYLLSRNSKIPVSFAIVLVGRSLDKDGSLCFLTDLIYSGQNFRKELSSLEFYTYSYCIDGIEFSYESGYDLIKKGF